uniref:hypothetical protein n=1 Tax=Parabacteroides distasonis TaxID=823 RepID=UPI003FF154B2
MNIRQTMLHLSGGLLLLLTPACTSEVDLEGGQPLEVTAEIVSSLSTRAVDATNYDKSSFSTDDEIQINGGSQTVTYRKDATNGWIPKTAGSSLTVSGSSTASSFSASYPAAFTFILQDGSNVTLSSNKVNFTFMPVAAKITISINYASSGGATTKYRNVTATLAGNGIRTGASSSETIEMLHTGDNAAASDKHTFVCILRPGANMSFKLSVSRTLDGASSPEATQQTFTQPAYTFGASKNYVYNFTSSDELILTSVEVMGFTETTVPDNPISAT